MHGCMGQQEQDVLSPITAAIHVDTKLRCSCVHSGPRLCLTKLQLEGRSHTQLLRSTWVYLLALPAEL